jgi:hypothetical protein
MIRVFARKTKWSPTDELAFFDGPPLEVGMLCDQPVFVSVTFTWDIARGYRLLGLWRQQWNRLKYRGRVRIGGPAFGGMGGKFVSGRFLKRGVTITSRGCPKKCPWCLVPVREGGLTEIYIEPGHIVQDDNLLACSRRHVETVFQMLMCQKAIQFAGGLDIEYLKPWHIEWLKQMRIGQLYIACDSDEQLAGLDKAADLLADFPIDKKRCYVLVGFDGEQQADAQRRCERVLAKGFLPFAQLYRGPASSRSRGDWREFCYFWSLSRDCTGRSTLTAER